MSRLAGAAPAARPTRLFIMYIPHGMPDEHFDPGPNLTIVKDGPKILDPLADFAANVTVLRGISMNDGATNHAAIRATLTGFAEGAKADSIDYSIAQALKVTAHALGVVPYASGAGFGSDSFLIKHGDWVSPTASPDTAAQALLQGIAGPSTPSTPAVDESVFRQEALGLTEKELETLQKAVTGLSAEQSKLQVHLDAIRKLKTTAMNPVMSMSTSCTMKPSLPAVDAAHGLKPLDQTNFGKLLDAQLEASATAILCNTARVITLQNMWVNSDLNFGFDGGPGVAKGHHDPVSHSWDTAGRDDFRKCQRWFYERLAAKLLTPLNVKDPSDPDHTVLDNTLVFVCSEISDGANHNSDASQIYVNGKPQPSFLPFVLIGGAGGYIKPGRVIDVKRKHIDVLATLSDAMGVPVTTIGGTNVSVIQEVKG
jgi:hypothetical protein